MYRTDPAGNEIPNPTYSAPGKMPWMNKGMHKRVKSPVLDPHFSRDSMMARGGSLKRKHMMVAHFNPHELDFLDQVQGKTERCKKSGMRSYSHLEELLKNPHILKKLVHSVHKDVDRKNYAQGGRTGEGHDYHDQRLNHLADQGRHGDTELGLIGPHTRNVLDNLVKTQGLHSDRDPHGNPQYFSLGSILSGLKNVFGIIGRGAKKIAPHVAPYLGQAAKHGAPLLGQYLGEKLKGADGKAMGEKVGNFVGSMANAGLGSFSTPEQNASAEKYAGFAKDIGNQAYKGYKEEGLNRGAQNALGAGLQHLGTNMSGITGGALNMAGRGVSNMPTFISAFPNRKPNEPVLSNLRHEIPGEEQATLQRPPYMTFDEPPLPAIPGRLPSSTMMSSTGRPNPSRPIAPSQSRPLTPRPLGGAMASPPSSPRNPLTDPRALSLPSSASSTPTPTLMRNPGGAQGLAGQAESFAQAAQGLRERQQQPTAPNAGWGSGLWDMANNFGSYFY